jgi:hypothetical protein
MLPERSWGGALGGFDIAESGGKWLILYAEVHAIGAEEGVIRPFAGGFEAI